MELPLDTNLSLIPAPVFAFKITWRTQYADDVPQDVADRVELARKIYQGTLARGIP